MANLMRGIEFLNIRATGIKPPDRKFISLPKRKFAFAYRLSLIFFVSTTDRHFAFGESSILLPIDPPSDNIENAMNANA